MPWAHFLSNFVKNVASSKLTIDFIITFFLFLKMSHICATGVKNFNPSRTLWPLSALKSNTSFVLLSSY